MQLNYHTSQPYILRSEPWRGLHAAALQACVKHPERKETIEETLQMALDEIEQGESLLHEIELAHSDIKQLTEG